MKETGDFERERQRKFSYTQVGIAKIMEKLNWRIANKNETTTKYVFKKLMSEGRVTERERERKREREREREMKKREMKKNS